MRRAVTALALACCVLLAGGARPASARVPCAGVDLAPTLASDRNPDGTPVRLSLDARGRYVPVVMIHGWTGRSTHSRARTGSFSHLIDLTDIVGQKIHADRSLIGQIQRIPGAAVFTFDYHDFSARWVTDDHVGPALGRAIDCLYETTGERVILVAHSMGGLASRQALTAAADARANKVSTLITFGTPQLGSDLASVINGAIVGASVDSRVAATLRMILAVCGDLSTEKLETGTLCDMLPDAARTFDSEAGRALRTGSKELRALDPVPARVHLTALAGSTDFDAGALGWFGQKWEPTVNLGDVIVMKSSATQRARGVPADTVVDTKCHYTFNVFNSAANGLGIKLGQVAASDVAQPIWKVHGPCFHGNLMRNIRLTNEATATIAEDIGRRTATGPQPSLTAEPVNDADLPVCRDFVRMSSGEADVAVRRMQEAHNDTASATLAKLSVKLFCKLNPGRLIDGVYVPRSRANPVNGGEGPIPTCADWREMDDAHADAALMRVAREHGDKDIHLATLRLSVGALCAAFPNKQIDAIYLG
jgi:pimeloyl-ACP methyl ester carboxylesterase